MQTAARAYIVWPELAVRLEGEPRKKEKGAIKVAVIDLVPTHR